MSNESENEDYRMGFLAGRQSEAKDRQDEKIDRLQSLFETQASTMAQQSVVMNTILKKNGGRR